MIPDFRFYVTWDSITQEVFPLNFNATSLIDEVDSGTVIRRQKFNGNLLFGTNSWAENVAGIKVNRKVDFDFFYDIELINVLSSECSRIDLEITRDGNEYWTGYFSTTDGTFDHDNCTFEVCPNVTDKYSPFDENGDTQFNLLGSTIFEFTTHMTRAVATTPISFIYDRNKLLTEVIVYLAKQASGDALITLSSEFLTNAINPITQTTNHYNYLSIAQKSDIKRWDSSDRAWKGFMSFNECMEILKCMNLYWDYNDTTHVFTVEHKYTWDAAATDGIDLRTDELAEASNKYSYSKSDMPRIEKFSWMEGEYEDFIAHTIYYDSSCVNQDKNSNTVDTSFNVTTDIEYIQDCMDTTDKQGNISDDGWVILANFLDGGNYYVYLNSLGTGHEAHFNADMGWGLLHHCFFKHDRVLLDGYINGTYTTFYSARRCRVQEAAITNCYANGSHVSAFDASQLLTTELGETYFGGVKAFVNRAEIFPSGLIKLNLAYGPPENPIVPVSYKNVIQIYEQANATYPDIPTATTYYASANINADADITMTFTIRLFTDFASLVDSVVTINIASGTKTGSTVFWWNTTPPPPGETIVCRFTIINVVVAGSALTWETSIVYDSNADCV